ncbi:MAG: 50S ribosomal protein L4 [Candidatus Nealsonbacteria bacterium RIFCSPLOWO2_01_FULL_43_32]|uniref:Large ribosomal subunit protein uL4 n=1 Tax=Candidatus Nealsonbacteria bacterium RIFCSPLOWO2_01_FULL_43_32 TaxID=1801672 RepID=A0A1G2EH87_9BACT|nr:MAG: 50S ribosomal protein L4 [Candidatus Nealsonbacteria bacterium RIFCSPLOWO2_01_FULL_43_32]
MLTKTYNQIGEELAQTRLPSEIFDVKMDTDLVHQVAVAQMSNRRQVSAHTKDRGEVRGGGKKPWRQKGTGRARHGSRRSPLWKGGGVTFGPTKERNFKKKINQKMGRKALLMVLSAKVKSGTLIILDSLKIEKLKTKLMADVLSKLPCKEQSCLIALSSMDKDVIASARNLAKVQTRQAKDLNVLDLLNTKYLIVPKDAIKVIKETFSK